jgi:hypothetical protein
MPGLFHQLAWQMLSRSIVLEAKRYLVESKIDDVQSQILNNLMYTDL